MLPKEHTAQLNLVTIPEHYFSCDTISLQNSVLELIQNLQLGVTKMYTKPSASLVLVPCCLQTVVNMICFMLSKTLTVKHYHFSK